MKYLLKLIIMQNYYSVLRGPYYQFHGEPLLLSALNVWDTYQNKRFIQLLSKEMRILGRLLHGNLLATSVNRKSLLYNEYSKDFLIEYLTPKENEISFETAMQERSNEIINKVKDLDNIYLLWSGGIDSTCVLYAILDSENYNLIADRFSVLCTKNIHNENPRDLNRLSKRTIIDIVDGSIFLKEINLRVGNSLILTGFGGDQLGDSSIVSSFLEPIEKVCRISWEDGLIQLLGHVPPFIEALVELAPYKLKYITELGWFLNLLFKRDDVSTQFPILEAALFDKQINERHFLNFFHTDSFKDFSLSYHKNNEMTFGNRVKPFMKDFIYEHNKDRDYYENKGKEKSMQDFIAPLFSHIGYVGKNGDYILENIKKCSSTEVIKKLIRYSEIESGKE